jgi:hypothetical protein
LFIDIVGYSKLLIEEQKERLGHLRSIVLGTAQVRESTDEHLVRLPTGDGMAFTVAQYLAALLADWTRLFAEKDQKE